MSIEIYDNFLDNNTFKQIKDEVTGMYFDWYVNHFIVDMNNQEEVNNITSYQLVHPLYSYNVPTSKYYDLFLPILDKLNILSLLRLKANCNFSAETNIESGMHIDIPNVSESLGAKTAVFYFNTNDGYTKFEDTGEKIESVENRLIIFDLNRKHTGSRPTNTKSRYVLNINYIPTQQS